MKSLQHGARACYGTLMGKELYRVKDDMGFVVVTQRGDKRVLSFNSMLEQSSMLMTKPYYLTHEYTQIMLLGLLFVEAGHMTLLGLGGGSLAHCLSHFYPQRIMQVVELRQAVIDVAYEWFNLPKVPNLQVKQYDAKKYLSEAAGSTDIIFSDLYEAEAMSGCQMQQEFIEDSYRILSEYGCLVINYHSMPDKDEPVMCRLAELFSEIYLCDVINGNHILFCTKKCFSISDDAMNQRAEALVQLFKMPLMYYYRKLEKL